MSRQERKTVATLKIRTPRPTVSTFGLRNSRPTVAVPVVQTIWGPQYTDTSLEQEIQVVCK